MWLVCSRLWLVFTRLWLICSCLWLVCTLLWLVCSRLWLVCTRLWLVCSFSNDLFVSVYRPTSLNNQYFCDCLSELLDFYSSIYDNKIVFGDFNLEISHLVMLSFMNDENFINLVKGNACFKSKGSCIDLILTNRRYSFKHTSSTETGLSDHHHLISSMMKTTFEKEEYKVLVYRDYKILTLTVFSQNCCLNVITITWLLLPLRVIL